MTNKPTYMKRIIAGSSLLFSILLATPQAYAQESVDVIIRENGTERREVIDLPKSMTYPVDSLLSDWKAKNYIDLGKDCSTSTVNPQFSDSVYIDRLSRMPTIMEMPYNEIVRKFIDMYTGRLRNQVAFMLSACNFYMPIFEEALDTYGLPLELKYLPKKDFEAKAAEQWQQAVEQIDSYARAPRVEALRQGTQMHKIVMQFSGWDLMRMEEV